MGLKRELVVAGLLGVTWLLVGADLLVGALRDHKLASEDPPMVTKQAAEAPDAPRYLPPIQAVEKVKDGDTIVVMLSLGFEIYHRATVRLNGIDTPEAKGYTAVAAGAAHRWVENWLTKQEQPLYLKSIKWDKYGGRVLGDVITHRGESLVEAMLAAKVGRPYKGEAKLAWTTEELQAVENAHQ